MTAVKIIIAVVLLTMLAVTLRVIWALRRWLLSVLHEPALDQLRYHLHARRRRWPLAVLAVLGVALVFLSVWLVPPALYGYVMEPKDRATAEASTRTGMIAGFAGLAALIGLSYTARTYRVTEQGHITDRYTKAIDQLGSTRLDVRLGGIYALERIAVDSARDHPTVVQVLSAYIREHTTPPRRHDRQPPRCRQQSSPAAVHDKAPPPLTADVQAAATVLGRLPARQRVPRGDLTGARLTGVQLAWANLSGAWLIGAELSDAGFVEADLSDAWLCEATLSEADLLRANLGSAELKRAILNSVNLSGAWLRSADLSEAELIKADLSDAQLHHANLSGAKLHRAHGLTQQQVNSANGDEDTELPFDCQPPDHWPSRQWGG